MIIEFTDINEAVIGTVTYLNGRLVASTDALRIMVEQWLERGKTEREFLDKYSNWSNGFMWSELKSK